jgi:Alginate export
MCWKLSGWSLVALALPASLLAQAPAYNDLRWHENWSYLRDHARRSDYLDPMKYIALGEQGSYLSFGGESRTRYEFFRNAGFGSAPNTPNGFLIQRYLLHADLHLGPRGRIFLQFQSGLEEGRVGGPRATDTDRLELHQAFVDLATSSDEKKAVTFRLGRQELEFGSGHYFSASEVFNVRRSFDAARVYWQSGNWTWNALVARPVELNQGIFDDSPDHRQEVWAAGVYGPNPLLRKRGKANISFFYIGYQHKLAVFDKGAGPETRHTMGSRIWGTAANWDYNYEVLFQTGTFGADRILALGVATETGYSRPQWRFSPRFALRSDTASGDRDRNSHTLGTFNPLFPTTAYSGRIGLIGAANISDVTPTARFRLSKRVYFLPETSFFWRESVADGIYSVLDALQRTGRLSAARYVGAQASAPLQISIDRHFTYTALVTRFFAGQYLKQTPPGRSVTYFTTFLTYRF